MWPTGLLLLLVPGVAWGASSCECNGIQIAGSDQMHCWEVVQYESTGWVAGDVACQTVGGHLGHMNTDVNKLMPYIKKVYSRPILTGIVVGNVDTGRYGLLCPNNNYYGLMNDTSNLLVKIALIYIFYITDPSATCAFITNDAYKVHFAPCTISSDALCDRPVEKQDYCNMMINCSSTTSVSTPTTHVVSTSTMTSSSTVTTSPPSSTTTAPNTTSKSTSTGYSTSTASPASSTSVSTSTSASISSSSTSSPRPTSSPSPSSAAPVASSTPVASSSPVTYSSSAPGTSASISSSSWSPVYTVAPNPSCKADDCAIKIYSMCLADWLFWLLLALIALALLCCCLLCCCSRKKNTTEEFDQNTVKASDVERSIVVPPVSDNHQVVRYSPEPTVPTLPPPAMESTPVVIVPMPIRMSPPQPRREIVERHTREILVVEKEKMAFKDVGVNTDPWMPTLDVVPRKEKQITPTPLDNDDIADDISIDMPRTPSPDQEIVPVGDVPVGDVTPVVFSRNARPNQFDGKRRNTPQNHEEFVEAPEKDPATVISLTADPRAIRSPPVRQKNVHLPTQEVPSFSPISDVSADLNFEKEKKPKHRFPSPPKIRQNASSNPKLDDDEEDNNDDMGPNDNRKPNAKGPGAKKSPQGGQPEKKSEKKMYPDNDDKDEDDGSDAPYRRREQKSPFGGGAPLMKPPEVSIRAAKGRLGGVVRAGGGPDENAPQGWKPWAKTSKNFQPSGLHD